MQGFANAVLILLIAGIGECAQAQDRAVAVSENALRMQLDRIIPELMARYQVPGVAIAIVDAGGPVHLVGYGFTNAIDSVRVQDSTIFEGASLGKPLFAYALLHEVTEHPLDLNRRVAEYLGAPIVAGSAGATITARQLLSHSSGLAFSAGEGGRYLAFPPGSRWQYSGLGFGVLQQVAEKYYEASLEQMVRRTVTAPLHMKSTSYLPPEKTTGRAAGHDRQGRQLPGTDWGSPSAASSLHTSARDYGRFLSAMLSGLYSMNDSCTARMVEKQIEADKSRGLSWGLGWAIAEEGSDRFFLHWGSNPGYKSLALGSLRVGRAMVVLTNGDNGLEIATALVPVVFGHHYAFLDFTMLHPDD